MTRPGKRRPADPSRPAQLDERADGALRSTPHPWSAALAAVDLSWNQCIEFAPRAPAMFDEMERLLEGEDLRRLLAHYGDLGKADRQAWQDRLMELDGVAPRDLAALHGELLAYGWLEQNTGLTPGAAPGSARGCYRVTPAGVRACKELRSAEKEPSAV
jgi:hypothetical protein